MITKIAFHGIEHQPNIIIFVWDCYNLVESKPRQIMKINSKSTKYWMIKLIKKKAKKNSIRIKINERWDFFKKKKLFIIVIKLDSIIQPWNTRSDSLFNQGLKLIRIRDDSIWDLKTTSKNMI